MPALVLALLALTLASPAAQADGPKQVSIGTVHALESRALGETRTIRVHLPPGYAGGKQRFPVLYLTDAETDFAHTATTADYLAQQGRIPPLIVVGVENTDRTRDLTPAPGPRPDGSRAAPAPGTGGADRFLAFFRDELVPWVEKEYRVLPYRVLSGHSFGGLFALHALLTQPGLFQAFLAVSPSFPWDDGYVQRAARPFFGAKKEAGRSVFVTVGNEPDYRAGFEEWKRLMAGSRADGFEGGARAFPDEDHGSIVLPSHYYGLQAIFSDWVLPRDPATELIRATRPQIAAHYRKLSERTGFPVPPPEFVVNLAGYWNLQAKRDEEALDLFELNAANYPDSPNVHDSLGEALEQAGRIQDAKAEYRRAIALAEAERHPALPVFREHLARAESKVSAK